MKTYRVFLFSFLLTIASCICLAGTSEEADFVSYRNSALLDSEITTSIFAEEVSATRRLRDHQTQAPTIPHAIDGLTINLQINQCLSCHNDTIAPLAKAPTVAVSHYQNRDGEFMADISPRRYFCNQCHLPQTQAVLPITNNFTRSPMNN
jgi:cytochrome c-type protein NapB